MNKIVFFLAFAIISIDCLAQTYYEKGYFIDNQNIRTDCFIRNNDWYKNPKLFKYKLTESGQIQEADIKNIKEFSVPNSFKFIGKEVDIDMSPSTLKDLSTDKNPLWQRKRLFLKVLVEGEASLYYYVDKGIDERFFYSCKDTAIHQLIYKEYVYDLDHTAFNDSFLVQLKNNVRCSFASDIALSDLTYTKHDLVKYFIDYNTCIDPNYKVPDKKRNKGELSLALSTGIAFSSLSISNIYTSYADANFGKKINPTYSLIAEYFLPINNKKWAISFGPTFQTFHSNEKTIQGDVSVDFESIDFTIGLKYYFYLGDKTKLYIGSYYNALAFLSNDSKIGYKAISDNYFSYFDINRYKSNFIISTGFEHKRIFADLRYFTNQDILSGHSTWNSNLEKLSLSLGYKFYKTKP